MSNETIKNRLKIISELKEEVNKLKSMKEDSLDEDMELQEIQDEIKEIRTRMTERKNKIMSNSSNQDIEDQLKELRGDIRDQWELLAQELADYYKDSGSLEIEDNKGLKKRIIFSAKLVNP